MTDDHLEPSKPPGHKHEKTPAGGRSADAKRSRRMRQIALAVCLSVAAAGISVAIASAGGHARTVAGGGQAAATAPSGHASAGVSARITTTGHTAQGAETANASARWPRRLMEKMLRWKAGPGGVALAAVETQMGTAMQSAGLRLYPAMRIACVRLSSAVSTARSAPPIPQPSLQRSYTRALSGLSRAAEQCRAALSIHVVDGETIKTRVNRYLLTRSRVEFAAASKELFRAAGDIQALGA